MPAYKRRLSDEKKNKIKKLWQQGLIVRLISDRLGVPAYTINNLIRKWKQEGEQE